MVWIDVARGGTRAVDAEDTPSSLFSAWHPAYTGVLLYPVVMASLRLSRG